MDSAYNELAFSLGKKKSKVLTHRLTPHGREGRVVSNCITIPADTNRSQSLAKPGKAKAGKYIQEFHGERLERPQSFPRTSEKVLFEVSLEIGRCDFKA